MLENQPERRDESGGCCCCDWEEEECVEERDCCCCCCGRGMETGSTITGGVVVVVSSVSPLVPIPPARSLSAESDDLSLSRLLPPKNLEPPFRIFDPGVDGVVESADAKVEVELFEDGSVIDFERSRC